MVKRKWGWFAGIMFLVLLCGVLLGLNLPRLVQLGLEQLVAGTLPGQAFAVKVQRADMSGVDLTALMLGDPDKPALRIESLKVRFSLAGLWSHHLELLAIDGLQLQGQLRAGRFVPEGLAAEEGPALQAGETFAALPITIGQLSISHSQLSYETADRREQWPFNLELRQDSKNKKLQNDSELFAPVTGVLTLYQDGQELNLTLAAEMQDDLLSFQAAAGDFPIAAVAALWGQDVSGRLQFSAAGLVRLRPFAISSLDLHGAVDQFVQRDEQSSWGLNAAGPGKLPSLRLELSVADDKWQVESTGFVLYSPVELRVTTINGAGLVNNGMITGALHLPAIMLNGQNMGGLRLDVEQQPAGVSFSGSHASRIMEGVTVKIKGEVGSSPDHGLYGSLQLTAPQQKFAALHLKKIIGLQQDVALTGEFGFQAAGAFFQGKKSGDLQLQLSNAQLAVPDSEITVAGLKLALAIPDLWQLQSLPAQSLEFAAVNIGNLDFAAGKFAFQVESANSLVLENGVVNWSEGQISFSEAIRFHTSRQDYAVTLLCDRLSLAGLFTQFGVERAAGEGYLNGRIPLKLVDGRISFNNGLLSSPPGEGGTIKIGDLGLLTAGIPRDSAQFAQLDLAGEALKNFRYNSAALQLNSEGDDLLLAIKLDGQPVHPIPFSYDSRLGSLTRLEVGEKGGINQPIRLDINLRVPLAKIIEYGGGVQKLYKMSQ